MICPMWKSYCLSDKFNLAILVNMFSTNKLIFRLKSIYLMDSKISLIIANFFLTTRNKGVLYTKAKVPSGKLS